MKVLITGADGFIGRNIDIFLSEKKFDIIRFTRKNDSNDLKEMVKSADFIFHLAGINRPHKESDYFEGNVDLTKTICGLLNQSSKRIPLVFSSSIQAELSNPYGISKKEAEDIIINMSNKTSNPYYIFRLPNVFGKFSRPNYNSVVSTFCYNIANNKPVTLDVPSKKISLCYIDDIIIHFSSLLDKEKKEGFMSIKPIYECTLEELAMKIKGYKNSRKDLITKPVGNGFDRALYATYLSYLSPKNFSYSLKKHEDNRGSFVEILKTKNSGQFSFFTAKPGIVRGGHYHHTKSEKFLVISGNALFRFRNINSNDYYEIKVSDNNLEIIETVPGWTHDVKNIGSEDLYVLLWANEIFNPDLPDTYQRTI